MEQLSPNEENIREVLGIAEANRKEIIRALKLLDEKSISALMEQLGLIPETTITHPFGYYEIPLFTLNLSRIKTEIPVKLVDDDNELWKKNSDALGVFTKGMACIRRSHFDPVYRITMVICRDLGQQAVEQTVEHEIREGLRSEKTRGLPYACKEGFALATYCGYGGIWRTKGREDQNYWRNVFQSAQERGHDDVLLVEKLGRKLEPPYHPMSEYDLYRHEQRVVNEFIEEIGSDKPTEGYVRTKGDNWDKLRLGVFVTAKQFLESHGIGLRLQSEKENWEEFIGVSSEVTK